VHSLGDDHHQHSRESSNVLIREVVHQRATHRFPARSPLVHPLVPHRETLPSLAVLAQVPGQSLHMAIDHRPRWHSVTPLLPDHSPCIINPGRQLRWKITRRKKKTTIYQQMAEERVCYHCLQSYPPPQTAKNIPPFNSKSRATPNP
jgi:hypothetical protein